MASPTQCFSKWASSNQVISKGLKNIVLIVPRVDYEKVDIQ